jgi:hypothetical protein
MPSPRGKADHAWNSPSLLTTTTIEKMTVVAATWCFSSLFHQQFVVNGWKAMFLLRCSGSKRNFVCITYPANAKMDTFVVVVVWLAVSNSTQSTPPLAEQSTQSTREHESVVTKGPAAW